MTISPRAKALIEALHLPIKNEERWEIAQRFLDEQEADTRHMDAYAYPMTDSPFFNGISPDPRAFGDGVEEADASDVKDVEATRKSYDESGPSAFTILSVRGDASIAEKILQDRGHDQEEFDRRVQEAVVLTAARKRPFQQQPWIESGEFPKGLPLRDAPKDSGHE